MKWKPIAEYKYPTYDTSKSCFDNNYERVNSKCLVAYAYDENSEPKFWTVARYGFNSRGEGIWEDSCGGKLLYAKPTHFLEISLSKIGE